MRLSKIMIPISILFVIISLLFGALFSKIGNSLFLQPYVRTLLEKQVKIPVTITSLRLAWNKFELYFSMQDGSTIQFDGNYSLLSQSFLGAYRIQIQDLANLTALAQNNIRGSLATNGVAKGHINHFSIQGNTNLFESQTMYDIDVTNQTLAKVLFHMPDGKIERMLSMIHIPSLATGSMMIHGDFTPSDQGEIQGKMRIKLTQGTLNASVLKQYDVEIPKDVTFHLDSSTHLDGSIGHSRINMESDILRARIKKATFNLAKYTLKTDYWAEIHRIVLPYLSLEYPVTFSGSMEGDFESFLIHTKSTLFDSRSNTTLLLKQLKPSSCSYDLKHIHLSHALSSMRQPRYATGLISIKGQITDFDTKNLSGIAKIETKNVSLNHAVLNKKWGLALKNNIDSHLESTLTADKHHIRAKIDLQTSLGNVTTDATSISIMHPYQIHSDYRIVIPNLSTLESIIHKKLMGSLTMDGVVRYHNSSYITAKSKIFGGTVDLVLENQTFSIHAHNVHMSELLKTLNYPYFVTGGLLQLNSTLTTNFTQHALRSLTGKIRMHASDVMIQNYDIDTLLTQFKKSKKLDFVDLGAFVLAGPLGALVTKGIDSGRMTSGFRKNSTSFISEIRTDVDLSQGVAKSRDVAIATKQHRIAAKGEIDLGSQAFKNFSVALLDSKGCPEYQQRVKGTITHPKISSAETVTNVLGSLLGSLVKPTQKLLKSSCNTPYYQGKVKHPSVH
jgi:hypothetical protein